MIKKQIHKVCIVFITSLFAFSCTEKPKVIQFQDIAQERWNALDTLTFQLKHDEIIGKNPTVLIRHSNDYNFQNIWLKLAVNSDQFKRQEILLSTPDGHWFGKKSGNLYTYEYSLENIKLDTSEITIKVVQNMRENPLKAIQSVGFKID